MTYCEFCGRQLENGERCRCRSAVKPDAAAEINGIFASAAQTDPFFHAPQDVPVRRERQQEIPSAAFEAEQIPQPVQPVIPEEPPEQTAAVKSKKKSGILLTAAAFLLALTGFLVWFFVFRDTTPDCEKPLKQFFQGINQRDYRICKEQVLTDRFFRESAGIYGMTEEELRKNFRERCKTQSEEMDDWFEEASERWDVDKGAFKLSYSVLSKNKMSRNDLREIETVQCPNFYESGELKEGYLLKIRVTVKAGMESESARGAVSVVRSEKEGWMLMPDSSDGFGFYLADVGDLIPFLLTGWI